MGAVGASASSASSATTSAVSYVPDVPIGSIETVISVGGPQSTIITTIITFPTPKPTSSEILPSVTVIAGTTYTIIRDIPYTGDTAAPTSNAVASLAVVRQPAWPPEAGAGDEKGAATPTTLAKGQYWIRAVEAPNFHKYLQTSPANSVGVAVLASSKTAGQFNIVDGQLVEATGADPLYLNVEKPADFTQRTLATWFNTTKNAFGTFVFSGDAVTWSAPEVKRQNLAAWLVCKGAQLFINTGAYAYQTPSGCADETVSFSLGESFVHHGFPRLRTCLHNCVWVLLPDGEREIETDESNRFISTTALLPWTEDV